MYITFDARWLALFGGLAASAACAQTSPWSLHAGAGWLHFSPSSHVEVMGTPVPGAGIDVSGSKTVALEVAYEFQPRWALRMALGVPPTARLRTAGSLNALVPPLTGKLGEVRYAPLAPSITYRLASEGLLRPYVGAGLHHLLPLSTSDADVSQFKVHRAWGPLVQAGVDVAVSPHWSVYLDVRKLWLKTTATGTLGALGGVPVRTEITLRPVSVFAGVGYRF